MNLKTCWFITALTVLISFAGSGLSANESSGNYFKLPKLSLKEDRGLIQRNVTDDISLSSEYGATAKGKYTSLKIANNSNLSRMNFDEYSDNSRSLNTGEENYFSEKYLKEIVNEHKYWESEKHFGTAVAEMAIVEFIPWALSKWVTKPGWANVGWQSWWSNIQKGWEYDGDNFLTNNFAHPYHGNLYFNTARTNGYDFWESMPFAFTGSLLWEYFGEYYRPSFNDWINTSVSGINLGEMTYRVSNLITDNTTRGSDRVWTEIFGALVNPVRGFNRLISGEASKVHPNTKLFDVPVRIFVDAGMRRIVERGSDFSSDSVSTEGLLGFNLIYGNENYEALSVPFSRFRVWGHISNGTSKLTDLFSYGWLTGWKLGGKGSNRQYFSLNLAYNFLTNPAYEFGGPGVLGLFTLTNKVGEKNFLKSDFGLYAILMGSTSTEYFYGLDGRNYDFGPGPGILLQSSLTNGIWNYLTVNYQGFTIFTMSGSPDSKHYLHNGSISTTLPLNNYFAIGAEFSFYWRNSFYAEPNPDVSRTSPMGRLFFVTKL